MKMAGQIRMSPEELKSKAAQYMDKVQIKLRTF